MYLHFQAHYLVLSEGRELKDIEEQKRRGWQVEVSVTRNPRLEFRIWY